MRFTVSSLLIGCLASVPGWAAEPAPAPGPLVVEPIAPAEAAAVFPHAADGEPAWSTRQQVLLDAVTPEMLGIWNTDAHLERFLPATLRDGDAGPLFKELETLYLKEKRPGKATVAPEASGVDRLLEAAALKSCRLTPEPYPHMDEATRAQPDYIVYVAYIRALLERAEQLARAGRTAEAEACYRAGLQCGRHLTNDRSNLIVFMLGLSFKQRSAERYARFLRNQLRYEEAAEADRADRNIREKQSWLSVKAQVLLGEFRKFNCLPSAIRIAESDSEPCWRQEAICRLAVLRHGAPWGMDENGKPLLEHDETMQNLARQALEGVAERDPAPWIRSLATWSLRHLTPDRFAEMRQKALLQQNAHLEQ